MSTCFLLQPQTFRTAPSCQDSPLGAFYRIILENPVCEHQCSRGVELYFGGMLPSCIYHLYFWRWMKFLAGFRKKNVNATVRKPVKKPTSKPETVTRSVKALPYPDLKMHAGRGGPQSFSLRGRKALILCDCNWEPVGNLSRQAVVGKRKGLQLYVHG